MVLLNQADDMKDLNLLVIAMEMEIMKFSLEDVMQK